MRLRSCKVGQRVIYRPRKGDPLIGTVLAIEIGRSKAIVQLPTRAKVFAIKDLEPAPAEGTSK